MQQQNLHTIFSILGYQPTVPRIPNVHAPHPNAIQQHEFLPLIQQADYEFHQLMAMNPQDFMQQPSDALNQPSAVTDAAGDVMFHQAGGDSLHTQNLGRCQNPRVKRTRDKGKGKAPAAPYPYPSDCRDVIRGAKRRYREQIELQRARGNNIVDHLRPATYSTGNSASSHGPLGYSRALMALEEMVANNFLKLDSNLWLFAISWLKDDNNREPFLGLRTLSHRRRLLEHHFEEQFGP